MTLSQADGRPLVLALMGPTASGKTDLAIALAKRLDAEIISVDSALVYRGLNVGAAKPSATEMDGVPHHLIDIRDPNETYTAGDFCRDAKALIKELHDRKKCPLLVGGTMMYFKALLEGLANMPPSNSDIRDQIETEAMQKGWPFVHQQLKDVDPLSAEKIHPNHSQRLSRALEVYRITGEPMSSFHLGTTGGLLEEYRWVQFALSCADRSALHRRIAMRFDKMMAAGLVDEVASLRARGDLHADLPSMRAVGYRQVWAYLDGEYGEKEMRERAMAATRQLAKRQLTWLRSWSGLHWLEGRDQSGENSQIKELVDTILKIIGKRAI